MKASESVQIPLSELPDDGLRFFHGLTNWIEESKTVRPKIKSWKKGVKALRLLTFVKYKRGEDKNLPKEVPHNTLYVPVWTSGLSLLKQLRHAFCHHDLAYDKEISQYKLGMNGKVDIKGQISLEAIQEFINIFVSETN